MHHGGEAATIAEGRAPSPIRTWQPGEIIGIGSDGTGGGSGGPQVTPELGTIWLELMGMGVLLLIVGVKSLSQRREAAMMAEEKAPF